MDMGLNGKVALVAASSKGLGFGVAQALAREGAKVSLCARNEEEVKQAAERLKAETGAETMGMACDMSKADQITAWVDATVKQWGGLDAVVVNAGGPPAGLLKDFTEEQWYAAFELTLMSTVRLIKASLPHLRRGGSILTVTSSSIKEPVERLGLSTVMRSGVAGLVKTLADELAGDGIRVNNLIPGRIDTDRVAALDKGAAQRAGISFEEARAKSIEKIPLKRLGTIEDFGNAAAFLLSPAASYITGASLQVDGGMMRSI